MPAHSENLPAPTRRARPRVERGANAALFGLLAASVLTLFLQPLWSITARIPASYDEGWNAYHAAAAIGGGTLYPPRSALISDNYPPLSFYVVGALGHLVGDNIIAGRFIALASLLVVAGNVFFVLRALGEAPNRIGIRGIVAPGLRRNVFPRLCRDGRTTVVWPRTDDRRARHLPAAAWTNAAVLSGITRAGINGGWRVREDQPGPIAAGRADLVRDP